MMAIYSYDNSLDLNIKREKKSWVLCTAVTFTSNLLHYVQIVTVPLTFVASQLPVSKAVKKKLFYTIKVGMLEFLFLATNSYL